MTKAPDLEALGEDQAEAPIQKKLDKKRALKPKPKQKGKEVMVEKTKKKKLPKVLPFRVYGVGGAGRIAANRFAERNEGHDIVTIDTARGMTRTVAGVQAIRINKLKGSGKVRSTNKEEIEAFIDERFDNAVFKEVSIIICSLSGGSGSVICPKLVKRIIQSGNIVIVLAIADVGSEIDSVNCMNSLIDLDKLVKDELKSYLPFVLFSNEYGHAVVDNGIDTIMDRLARLLHTKFYGSDPSDRKNFLRPHQVIGSVNRGLKLLNLTDNTDTDWDNNLGLVISDQEFTKIDSTIIISAIDVTLNSGIRSSVTYRGYFADDHETALLGFLGYSIPKEFMGALNKEIHAYRNAVPDEDTVIGFEDEDFEDEY